MARPTEQELARHFLVHRDNGYSIGYILRRARRRYGLHLAVLFAFMITFHSTNDLWVKGFSLWAVGMFLGALCRDVGWLRRIKKTWPFTQRITDWQAVEAIAEGRESADQTMAGPG